MKNMWNILCEYLITNILNMTKKKKYNVYFNKKAILAYFKKF